MAAKTHPYTTKLQYDLDGAPPFTSLTDMVAVTPPNMERASAESTHLESPNQARENQPGWITGGPVPFRAYFTKAQLDTLEGFFTAGTILFWRALLPLLSGETTNSMWAFAGWVSKVGTDEISVEGDDLIECPFEIMTTGLPVFTAGS